MDDKNILIFLPELEMSLDSLKLYFATVYNLKLERNIDKINEEPMSLNTKKIEVGDHVYITDKKSAYKGKSGIIISDLNDGTYIVKTIDGNGIVRSFGLKKIETMKEGGSIDNQWLVFAKTDDGVFLSERFNEPISHTEIFVHYKDKGFIVVDSQIYKISNNDVLSVFKDSVSKYVEDEYNETVDWSLSFISYKIENDIIIIKSCDVYTEEGNEYKITPDNLINKMKKGGNTNEPMYDVIGYRISQNKVVNINSIKLSFEDALDLMNQAEKSGLYIDVRLSGLEQPDVNPSGEKMKKGGPVKSLLVKEKENLQEQLNDAIEKGRYSTMSAIEESINRVDYLIEYEKETGKKVSAKEIKKLLNPYNKFDEKYSLKHGGTLKEKQKRKVGKVMHEWKEGKLHSGSKKGPIVKDQKQAIAIALSEAGISKKMNEGGGVDEIEIMSGSQVKSLVERFNNAVFKGVGGVYEGKKYFEIQASKFASQGIEKVLPAGYKLKNVGSDLYWIIQPSAMGKKVKRMTEGGDVGENINEKIAVAKKHMKRAEKTKNAGWKTMLEKRIKTYKKKLSSK